MNQYKQQTEYNAPITITFSNMVARVYTPILDSEERERQMKAIHKATANVLKSKLHNGKGETKCKM
jgi:hypothetical protein